MHWSAHLWATDSSSALQTNFLMLLAPGWGALIPPVSSPLATLLLSSLCLSRMACLASLLISLKMVLLEQAAEGPCMKHYIMIRRRSRLTGYLHIVWSELRLQ